MPKIFAPPRLQLSDAFDVLGAPLAIDRRHGVLSVQWHAHAQIRLARFVHVPLTFFVPQVARAALAVFAGKAALLHRRHVIVLHREHAQRELLTAASDEVLCTNVQSNAA